MKEFTCSDKTRLPVCVRVSAKATRMRLTLAHTGELQVVVPMRMQKKLSSVEYDPHDNSPNSVASFLEQHRRWIERAAVRTKQQRICFEESKAAGLPTHLEFPLCDEFWLVEYKQTQAKSVMAKPDGLRRFQGTRQILSLKISGAIDNEELCRKALVRFVTQYAKKMIPPFALHICSTVGIRPTSIVVNNRNSAWGVCTRTGDIRIDRRVLFLPLDLARQVVLHELAHLKHLNHSKEFYDALYALEGSSKEAEKAVKGAIQFIPAWFQL